MSDTLIPLGLFAMIVVIAWLRAQTRQSRLEKLAETRRYLLEKFQSGPELANRDFVIKVNRLIQI